MHALHIYNDGCSLLFKETLCCSISSYINCGIVFEHMHVMQLCNNPFIVFFCLQTENVPSEECFLQRSPSKRRWIFDSFRAHSSLFNEDVILEVE
jgi:hypothetical protein